MNLKVHYYYWPSLPKVSKQTLKIMKLIAIILFAACMQVSARGYSQITLSEINTPLQKVFHEIQKQSGYDFVSTYETLKEAGTVTVRVRNVSLQKALDECLKGKPLTYVIIGKTVVVKFKEKAFDNTTNLIVPVILPPPPIEIHGRVVNQKGESLQNASVLIAGTKIGTTTNSDGGFTINAANDKNIVLEISSVGYQTKKIKFEGQTEINITLELEVTGLSDVVVVGYGTQKKANLTGAVDQISGKQLESRPLTSVGAGLEGLVPNLNVTIPSGKVSGRSSDAPSLNIRGFTSINGGSPLILLDGVSITLQELSTMNSNDVQSITVLKDAASSAIYGARAAYGVILITTKSATSSKMNVSINAYTAFRTPGQLPTIITDPYEIMTYRNAVHDNNLYNSTQLAYAQQREKDPSLPAAVPKPGSSPMYYTYTGNTNWLDVVYQKYAPTNDINMSVSKKSDKLSYYFSSDYYALNGLFNYGNDLYRQFNMRGKVDLQVTPWLSFSNNTMVTYDTYNEPSDIDGTFFSDMFRTVSPIDIPKNPDGTWTPAGASTVGRLQQGGREIANTNNIRTTFSAKGDIIKGIWDFNADVTFEQGANINRTASFQVPFYSGPQYPVQYQGPSTPVAEDDQGFNEYNVVNVYTTAHKQFGNHFIQVMVGGNQEYSKITTNYANRTNFVTNSYPTLALTTGPATVGESTLDWAVEGLFTRINYSFKDKYLFEIDSRYDGTSRFPANSRWGIFPSASAGWVVSREPFFHKFSKFFTFLKVRGSYGSLGNQSSASPYAYIPTLSYNRMQMVLNSPTPGTILPYEILPPSAPPASNLTWETASTTDFGVDMSTLDNHLQYTFDVYTRRTTNMLVPGRTLPAVFGTSSPLENAADLKTKGFDMRLSWNSGGNLLGSSFHYSISLNLANNNAWITRFNNPQGILNNYYDGEKIGNIWGLQTLGFFQTDDQAKGWADQSAVGTSYDGYAFQAGDLKFADRNKDGKIDFGSYTLKDHGDLFIIGNSNPQFPFGIDLTGDWKGFDARIFFQGIGKRDWYPPANDAYFWGVYASWQSNVTVLDKNHWTPQNPNAYFPSLKGYIAYTGNLPGGVNEMSIPQTRYLQNAAYIRCKNITIGYSLPDKLVHKAKLEKVRFYFSAENIFEFDHLKAHLDPEELEDQTQYPFQRTYSVGLNFNF